MLNPPHEIVSLSKSRTSRNCRFAFSFFLHPDFLHKTNRILIACLVGFVNVCKVMRNLLYQFLVIKLVWRGIGHHVLQDILDVVIVNPCYEIKSKAVSYPLIPAHFNVLHVFAMSRSQSQGRPETVGLHSVFSYILISYTKQIEN